MPLSCARHTAAIYDRGGITRIGPVDPVTSVSWHRVRDDMSFGSITIEQPTWDCQQLLAFASANRHELVLFRDGERVWEGPISLITWGPTSVIVEARDVMYYTYRTIIRGGYSNAYPNIQTTVQRALGVLTQEMVRKEALDPPINMMPFVTTFDTAADSRTSKVTLPYQTTVYQDIDEMAARSGLDYTVVGRRLLLFDTHVNFAQTPQVSEADFINTVLVAEYGLDGATQSAVTDGQGHYGLAGAPDPYYGEWEILDTAYDENDPNADPTPPSVAEMQSQAVRNLDGRNPVPVVVRVPDGSRLNPNGVLSIDDLVPGVRIPLVATLTARTFSQMQKLDKVMVTETASGGEQITITMSPAANDDEVPV